MDLTGDVLRSASSVDETALQQIIATLKQQGLDWSQMSMRDKAKIFDPILKSALNK
jgi:N-acetylglutamate synthase-like GNAT family acetyltransferase